jgi:FAD/FMN-containing dehydrogenase
MPAIGLSTLHGDPDTPMPGVSDSANLDELPASAISTFVQSAEAAPSLLVNELRHIGGAAGRPGEGHGALSHLDGEYVLFGVGIAATPEMGAAVARESGALVEAMAPYGHGSHYLNFTEHRVDTRSAYSEDAYARLRAIRAKVDPDALFRANHEIA